eukprot:408240-Rhodomonas_salina.1
MRTRGTPRSEWTFQTLRYIPEATTGATPGGPTHASKVAKHRHPRQPRPAHPRRRGHRKWLPSVAQASRARGS